MRGLLVVLVLALVPVALSSAPIPKKLKNRSAVEQLLGNWALTNKNAGYRFTIEYKRDGELEFHRVFNNNRKTTSLGSYTFDEPNEENPLGSITWKVKEGGSERGETSKITKLTDTHLTFVDPEGLVEEFERE